MITYQRLREVLRYDPETGIFTWLVITSNRVLIGDVAGTLNDDYLVVQIDGRKYRAHRLAWFYMTGEWPSDQIDHWDLNRANNRWENLRKATNSKNSANTRRPMTNTSGFKGVWLDKPTNKWRAKIQVRGEQRYLGYFDTPESAHHAYVVAATQYFGEFARG